ncbi:MAG: hypothetical protein ABIP51_11180 [Bacteroidia bacterium]
MAEFKLAQLFDYKNVTPSSLQKGQLVYFKYNSPNGVHDKSPLVYVIDKTFDKIYAINLHYDMNEIQELTEGIQTKVNTFLENKWYAKHPEKRTELQQSGADFDPSLIEKKELADFKRGFNKKDLEVFALQSPSRDAFRSYLYKRMNNVSKLVWKL